MMLLAKFEALLHELLSIDVLEEQLTRILGFLQRDMNSLSSGVFFYQENRYRLKLGRNISHTYTKNTIFHDEDEFIRELRDSSFLSLKDKTSCQFEHECRHIIVNILEYRKEVYGFIFADKKTEYFTAEEESVFRIIAELTALLFSVSKLAHFWSAKRELDEDTHIFRYKSFMEKGSYLFRLLNRSPFTLSVAALKINKFDNLVKIHGRQQTDMLLQEIFAITQQNIRPIDILGKIFDDTYAVIFPNLDQQKTEKIISKIHRQLIEHKEIFHKNLSWGIAGMDKGVSTFEQVVSNAEEASFDASRNDTKPVIIYE